MAYFAEYDVFGTVVSNSRHGNDVSYIDWELSEKMPMEGTDVWNCSGNSRHCVWNGHLIFSDDDSEKSRLAIRLKYGSKESCNR